MDCSWTRRRRVPACAYVRLTGCSKMTTGGNANTMQALDGAPTTTTTRCDPESNNYTRTSDDLRTPPATTPTTTTTTSSDRIDGGIELRDHVIANHHQAKSTPKPTSSLLSDDGGGDDEEEEEPQSPTTIVGYNCKLAKISRSQRSKGRTREIRRRRRSRRRRSASRLQQDRGLAVFSKTKSKSKMMLMTTTTTNTATTYNRPTASLTLGIGRSLNLQMIAIVLFVCLTASHLASRQASGSPQVLKSTPSQPTVGLAPGTSQGAATATGCPYPATNQNSQVNIVTQAPAVPLISTDYIADEYANLKPDTQATYKCDHGFELLGQETLTCLQSGRWSGSPPSCVTNIALGKPTNQSSTVKGGDSKNANDGKLVTQHDSKYCTETRVDQSPWWQVDLLQVYDIRSVRILGRACCNAQFAMHDIEIRVGNSSTLQGNRLCAWYPDNLEEGVGKNFQCANPILGRYVSIQMVGIESALSLCEVMVFSAKEFPADRCSIQSTLAPTTNNGKLSTATTTTTTSATTTQQTTPTAAANHGDNQAIVFNRTCYEMQTTSGGSFLVADTYCKARGGTLVHSITDLTQSFLSQGLEQMKAKLKSKLVWIGAKRENASPNAQGPIITGSTSALVASESVAHPSFSRIGRSLSTLALNEFPVDNLFATDRGQVTPDEASPIFSPLKLARTPLVHMSSGAGGSTSRGSQTFGLSTASQQHPTNRSIEHPGRSLSIIQPNQVASFFAPPIPMSSTNPASSTSGGPSSAQQSSNNQQATPTIVMAPQSSSPTASIVSLASPHGPHRSLRPPSLVSQSSSGSASPNPSATSWSSSQGSMPHLSSQSTAAAAAAATSTTTSSSAWRWVGDAPSETQNAPITSFLWAEDQPNNYNNQQDCIVLDGGKRWLWNDVTCELDYLPWICQYRPSGCGSPDRNENSTILELSPSSSSSSNRDASMSSELSAFAFGKTITYACPIGHRLDGQSRTRKCLHDGTWSGKAPRCQYINCGPISSPIENGRLVYLNQSQTTFGSQVRYVCYEDYVLVGDDMRQCQADGKWAGKAPYCAYKWCPVLQSISNGQLNVSSYSENSLAIYQCNGGYKLIGNDTRQCLLGGKWTNQEPFCQYVDCGQPKQIPNGGHQLINGTTNYLSIVEYICNENYTLINSNINKMICSANNRWTGREPQCSLIDCGQPQANLGSQFTGDSFSVHSTIDYRCDPGFKEVSGSTQRTCNLDGQWTGQPLTCKYVDCGRVPAILKGEVAYINGTTYLASQVSYECTPGNRLSGHRVRFCGPDGRWTGGSPKCEEVRCNAPELPANGSAIYIGNDRSFKEQSFSVGVTVQYECDYGHVVRGSWASRLCQANGDWSGEAPVCKFVDCGPAPSIENGTYQLKHPPSSSISSSPAAAAATGPGSASSLSSSSSSSILHAAAAIGFGDIMRRTSGAGGGGSSDSNAATFTYYGTIAQYSCEPNFRLQGQAQRECLETGQWRLPLPSCEPIQCPKPEFFDEYTQVSLIPRGTTASSSSSSSATLDKDSNSLINLDHQTLIALASKSTKLIANNQWLVGQATSGDSSTTTAPSYGVGDKLYYSCAPGYELYGGPELRTCTQYGQWSGSSTPRCRLIDCGRPAPIGQEGRFYLLNETTIFNSLVEYSCVRPFKLIEVKMRQSGNLIETLQNAQAGVTPILTSLPIGVKVCANNGQWMPNDQQPKCVSGSELSAGGSGSTSTTTNTGSNGGQYDGMDNTLDGSHRSVQVLAGSGANQRQNGNNNNNNNQLLNQIDGTDDNLSSVYNGGYQQQQQHHNNHNQLATAGATSLFAKLIIAICLLVMLALIILTLICIRSGRKLKQVQIHRTSILTPSGHQAAAAAAMQIQLANGKTIQPTGTVASIQTAPSTHHHHHHLNHTHNQQQAGSLLPSQNIYINGMHKMLSSSMVGQSQMSAMGALGGTIGSNYHLNHHHHQQQQHHSEHDVAHMMASYGDAAAVANSHHHLAKSGSMAALSNPHNNHHHHHHHPAADHHTIGLASGGASSSSIMDTYSRLSIESSSDGQTASILGTGAAGQSVASAVLANSSATTTATANNKTIRHNPNGLVTFVSPAQQQQQQQTSKQQASSSQNNNQHQHHHQVSPQSISTSLSVSSSSSPSSSSSAHHTTATRLSGTDSASSPSSGNSASSAAASGANNNNNISQKQQQQQKVATSNNISDSSDYQVPTQPFAAQTQPPPLPQTSPPSLPAQPPPPHRVQQHHKQLMKYSSRQANGVAAAATSAGSRANQQQQAR